MNTPIVEYEGNQLEIDFDQPEFSICPSCEAQVIKLADGCSVCGWCEDKKLLGGEENLLLTERGEQLTKNQELLSIPCTIKHPKQSEIKGVIQKDLGDRFTVYIPDDDSTIIGVSH